MCIERRTYVHTSKWVMRISFEPYLITNYKVVSRTLKLNSRDF